MAIQVNDLIQRCYKKCSLTGAVNTTDGTATRDALEDLKSVIAKLNEQNLILSDVKTADAFVTDTITFAVLPPTWFEYGTYDEMAATLDEHQVGDICHIREAHDGNNFYSVVAYYGANTFMSTPDWQAYMRQMWPTHAVKQLPDRVIGMELVRTSPKDFRSAIRGVGISRHAVLVEHDRGRDPSDRLAEALHSVPVDADEGFRRVRCVVDFQLAIL